MVISRDTVLIVGKSNTHLKIPKSTHDHVVQTRMLPANRER